MTRTLLLIAVFGVAASLACFSVAASMGGFPWRGWFMNGHHSFDDDDWGHGRRHGPAIDGGGPTISREMTWDGSDSLTVAAPAEVTYTQGSPARMTVTGPKGTVDQLEIHNGRLRLDRRVRDAGTLKVVLTAPNVGEFNLPGAFALHILDFDQDQLDIRVAGAGSIDAKGRTRKVELNVAGSGDADLSALQTEDAEVRIAGSGSTTLSPTRSLEVFIAGSGDVTLTTDPPKVESKVFGSGRIIRAPAAPAAVPPAAAPSASPPPPAAQKKAA
jgi:hypothetical protein